MNRIIAGVLLVGTVGGSSRALTHKQVNQRAQAIAGVATASTGVARWFKNGPTDMYSWAKLGAQSGAVGALAFVVSKYFLNQLTPEKRVPRAVATVKYVTQELERAQVTSRMISLKELVDCAKSYQSSKWALVEMVKDLTRWNAMLSRAIVAFDKAAADKASDQALVNICALNKQKAVSKREIVRYAKKTLENSAAYRDEYEAYEAAKEVERLNQEHGFTYGL